MRMTMRRLGRVLGLAAVIVMLSAPVGLVQAALVWQIETVDGEGTVGFITSLALDSDGQPHISYSDITLTSAVLKYATFDGSSWQIETVDEEAGDEAAASLALDADGQPHISYFDINNQNLKYAAFDGSGWQIDTIDTEGFVGRHPSLALDGGDQPHISYYDTTNQDLKYAVLTDTGWQIETVDSTGNVGDDPSLALDGGGQPHISYYDQSNGALKYATFDGAGWQIEPVDIVGYIGGPSSLALDGGGQPHISYFDLTTVGLMYATFNGSAWQIETAVENAVTFGVLPSSVLDIDSSGQPHISYYDNTNSALKYATFDGTNWQDETVDAEGFVVQNSSLAVDAAGHPHISYGTYYGSGDSALRYTHLTLNEPPTVEAGGPYSGDEGSPITLDGSVSDPENDELTTTWSYESDSADPGATCTFGDPSQVGTTFSCTDDGTFTVTLTADDGLNPPVTGDASVTINNVAPTVTLGDDATIDEGEAFTDSGSFTDPGDNDSHTATADYGDGSGEQPLTLNPDNSFDLSHTYPDHGQYTVEVCVTDDDAATDCDELVVQVEIVNDPPLVDAGGPYLGSEHSPITLDGSVRDPEGDAVTTAWSYEIDSADPGTSCTFDDPSGADTTFTCNGNGTFTLTLTAADDFNAPVTDTATVTIGAGVTTLCANNYTGVLRYTSTCQDHETTITIPDPSGPVMVCASDQNGLLRAPTNGVCAGHETTYLLPEDGPLSVCVNTYTQTMRAVDDIAQCTSNEFGRVIAATEVGETTPPGSRT